MGGLLGKFFERFEKEPFDPAVLNDPIALATSWEPAKRGGANFKTRRLVQDGSNILFKPTVMSILFPLFFLIIGIAAPIGIFSKEKVWDPFLILMPIMFCGVGAAFLYSSLIPVIFDGREKLFWKGHVNPKRAVRQGKKVEYAPFDTIHAIQIVSEWVRGSGKNSSSFYSYELNLILQNGSRINVIDHGKLRDIQNDAYQLGVYLNVPVWDACNR